MLDDNQKHTCRICKSEDLVTVLSDLTTRLGEVYSLRQCRACSFISTSPLPAIEKLSQYYDQDYWLAGSGKTSKLLTCFYAKRMAGIIKTIKCHLFLAFVSNHKCKALVGVDLICLHLI